MVRSWVRGENVRGLLNDNLNLNPQKLPDKGLNFSLYADDDRSQLPLYVDPPHPETRESWGDRQLQERAKAAHAPCVKYNTYR